MAGMKPLTREQVEAVLETFSGIYRERNQALFMVSIETGFRSQEILSLRRGDVINEAGQINDRITVLAEFMKGREGRKRSRTVPLFGMSKRFLENWLTIQAEKFGLCHRKTPVFSTYAGTALGYWTHWNLYKKAFKKAGITERGFATHSARKTFAKENYEILVDLGITGELRADPIVELSLMMGHADPRATMHYTPRTNAGDLARERRRQMYGITD